MSSKSVPWKDWQEWREVYELVVEGNEESAKLACVRIRDWKLRCRVPISVEATAYLLESLLLDTQQISRSFETRESVEMLADAQCVSRFINLLTDLVQKGMYATSVETLANSIGIPSWIVQLRHTACHGTVFPRMGLLKRAARYLLYDFIIPRYWDAQAHEIGGDTDTVNRSWGLPRVKEWCRRLVDGVPTGTSPRAITIDAEALYWIVVELRDCMSKDDSLDAYYDVLKVLFSELASNETRISLIRLSVRYRNQFIIECAMQDLQLRFLAQSVCLEEINNFHSSTSHLDLINQFASLVNIPSPRHDLENSKVGLDCTGISFIYDRLLDT